MKKLGYLIFLLLGMGLLSGGLWGALSLAKASEKCLRAPGIVKRVSHERVYRPRKMRTVSTTDVHYETERYGTLTLTLDYSLPFLMDEGDEVTVLYPADRPREARVPMAEGLLYGLLSVLGAGCVWIGWRLK